MSGYVTLVGPCILCKQIFTYNPLRVPSTTVFTGKREPVCRDCMTIVNDKRRARGDEPFPIAADAYEGISEGELP